MSKNKNSNPNFLPICCGQRYFLLYPEEKFIVYNESKGMRIVQKTKGKILWEFPDCDFKKVHPFKLYK